MSENPTCQESNAFADRRKSPYLKGVLQGTGMGKKNLTTLELPSNLTTIGERIRWARRRLGWSQQRLADALDMDQTTVSKWEKNVYTPRNFGKLAETLEIRSPAWLAYGKETIDKLSEDAIELGLAYDSLTEEQQQALLNLLRSLK